MDTVFITGANRGIGLAIVKHFMETTDAKVFATARKPADASDLNALAAAYEERLIVVGMDVSDDNSILQGFSTVSEHSDHLDIVINNAGINNHENSLDETTRDDLLQVLNVNVASPVIVTKAALDLLAKSDNPRIVHISSSMASIGARRYAGNHSYGTSKAALNMIMRGMAIDLGKQGYTVIALDPGWVQTDMGGMQAALTPQQSASGIVNVVTGLTKADNGKFLVHDGTTGTW